MPYCTIADVEAYFMNKTFGDNDYVNSTKANALITSDYYQINAALRVNYSLPIEDADDLEFLKVINAKMTVGTIDGIFYDKTSEGDFNRDRGARKEALALLKQLKDGEIRLNSSDRVPALKFNTINSDGNPVVKRFKDSNIEPNIKFPVAESQSSGSVSPTIYHIGDWRSIQVGDSYQIQRYNGTEWVEYGVWTE